MTIKLAKRIARSTYWAIALRLVGILAGLAVNSMLARLLTPTELGRYFLLVSMVSLAAIIACAGTRQTIVRVVAESIATDQRGRAGAVILAAAIITATGAAIVACALLVLLNTNWSDRGPGEIGLDELVTGASICWIFAVALQVPIVEAFRGMHEARFASLFDGVLGALLLTLGLAVVLGLGLSISLAAAIDITVWSMSISLFAGVGLLLTHRKRLIGIGSASVAEVLGASAPLLITNVAVFAIAQSSLWIVGAIGSAEDVALFGSAWKLVTLVAMPIFIVNVVIQPFIAELNATLNREALQNSLRATATIAGIPALLILLLFVFEGRRILELVYGESYQGGARVLALLSIGHLFNVLTGSCDSVLAMMGRQRFLAVISFIAGGISILLGLLLMKTWGIEGVALAATSARFVQNLLSWATARIYCGVWTHVSVEPRLIKDVTVALVKSRRN